MLNVRERKDTRRNQKTEDRQNAPRHLNEISQAVQRELADHGGRMKITSLRKMFPKNEQSILQELLDEERTVFAIRQRHNQTFLALRGVRAHRTPRSQKTAISTALRLRNIALQSVASSLQGKNASRGAASKVMSDSIPLTPVSVQTDQISMKSQGNLVEDKVVEPTAQAMPKISPLQEEFLRIDQAIYCRSLKSIWFPVVKEVVKIIEELLPNAEVVVGGSVGKRSCIIDGADCVILVLTPFDKLDAARQTIADAFGITVAHSLKVVVKSLDFTIRFGPRYQSKVELIDDVLKFGWDNIYLFWATFEAERIRIILEQSSRFRICLRLLRFWRNRMQWTSDQHRVPDEVLEVITMHSFLSNPVDVAVALSNCLAALANFKQLVIRWPDRYRNDDILKCLQKKIPLVMDPASPFINWADQFQYDDLVEFVSFGSPFSDLNWWFDQNSKRPKKGRCRKRRGPPRGSMESVEVSPSAVQDLFSMPPMAESSPSEGEEPETDGSDEETTTLKRQSRASDRLSRIDEESDCLTDSPRISMTERQSSKSSLDPRRASLEDVLFLPHGLPSPSDANETRSTRLMHDLDHVVSSDDLADEFGEPDQERRLSRIEEESSHSLDQENVDRIGGKRSRSGSLEVPDPDGTQESEDALSQLTKLLPKGAWRGMKWSSFADSPRESSSGVQKRR